MAAKILIHRHVSPETEERIKPLLMKLRSLAMSHEGYISGETLRSVADPNESVVISTWETVEHWQKWLNHPERTAIQKQIDVLLASETKYQVYSHR